MKDYDISFKRFLAQPLLSWRRDRIAHVKPSEPIPEQPTPPTYHSLADIEQRPATTTQQTMRMAFHKPSVSFTPPGAAQQNILGKSETPRVQFRTAQSSMGAVITQGHAGLAVKHHLTPAKDAQTKPIIQEAGLADKSQQPFLTSLLVRLRGNPTAKNTGQSR